MYWRIKMKRKYKIIIISCLIIFIGAIFVWSETKNNSINQDDEILEDDQNKEDDQSKFDVDQNLFNQIKNRQTLILNNKEDVFTKGNDKYYVYFSKQDCPFCDMLEPVIEYYTVEYNNPILYCVNGDECKDLNIFVKDDEKESSNISGYTLPGVPSMLVIENGKLKQSLSGTEPINEELKSEALN